jgi:ribosome-binding factor A
MAHSYRKERLNERIKEIIGELVQRGIKDPRIGLVTITAVSIAPDYTSAKVYFTVMGDETARSQTREGLESAKNFIRNALGRELKLRQTPDLRFMYDETLDRAMRIDEAIERTRRPEDPKDTEDAG